MKRWKSYVQLLCSMLKIGLFTFGGGYAMIALLEDEFVTRKGWLEQEEFLDVAAIAESTPGPIAINAATYIGYKRHGVPGSVVATAGICIPSFVIIYLISLVFDRFLSAEYVGYAFAGIRVAVIYLISSAGLRMLKKMKKTPLSVTVTVLTVVLMLTFSVLAVRISTVLLIVASGIAGLTVYLIVRARKRGGV